MTGFLGKIPAGKLICFSEGEYSDYGYIGHFLTLEPITKAVFEVAKERIKARIVSDGVWKEHDFDDGEDPNEMSSEEWKRAYRSQFLGELIRMGKIMNIECTEFYLGAYGRLEL